jgi:hypothetical protein
MTTKLEHETNLKSSATAGAWWHNSYCSSCSAQIGHQEVMTQICLTCGTKFASDILGVHDRASRKVKIGDEWWVQHRYPNGTFDYSPSPPTVVDAAARRVFHPAWIVAAVALVIALARYLS